jgi:hypothetical protein
MMVILLKVTRIFYSMPQTFIKYFLDSIDLLHVNLVDHPMALRDEDRERLVAPFFH